MKAVAIALAILLGTSTQLSGQDSPEAVVNRFHTLQAAGDSLGSLELMASDVVIFESGGAEASRQEYRSHHLGIDVQFAASVTREIIDQQSQREGDLAWVLTRTRVTGTFRDREIDSRGVETMLLRRMTDGWRIIHVHWSSRRGE